MSRKTTQWKRLARQVNDEGGLSRLIPKRATGKSRFHADTLDESTLNRSFGQVCCRPMNEEKASRLLDMMGRHLKHLSSPSKKKRR